MADETLIGKEVAAPATGTDALRAAIVGTAGTATPTAVAKPAVVPTRPKDLFSFNTADLGVSVPVWSHVLVYSETSAGKTEMIADFCDPKRSLFIQTRRPEQMIHLREKGFVGVVARTEAHLRYCLTYPFAVWDQERKENSSLGELLNVVLDDGTAAAANLVAESDSKDARMSYREAGAVLRETICLGIMNMPVNFFMTAQADIRNDERTLIKTVEPKLPPAMRDMIEEDFEAVVFIDPLNYNVLTDRRRESMPIRDNEGRPIKIDGQPLVHTTITFAKNKGVRGTIPKVLMSGNRTVLADLTEKIKTGLAGQAGVVKRPVPVTAPGTVKAAV